MVFNERAEVIGSKTYNFRKLKPIYKKNDPDINNMVSMWHQVIKMSFSSTRHPPNRYLRLDINGVIERDIMMGLTAVGRG